MDRLRVAGLTFACVASGVSTCRIEFAWPSLPSGDITMRPCAALAACHCQSGSSAVGRCGSRSQRSRRCVTGLPCCCDVDESTGPRASRQHCGRRGRCLQMHLHAFAKMRLPLGLLGRLRQASHCSVASYCHRHRHLKARRHPSTAFCSTRTSAAGARGKQALATLGHPIARSTQPASSEPLFLKKNSACHHTHARRIRRSRWRLRTQSSARRQACRHEWSTMRAFELPDRHDAVS